MTTSPDTALSHSPVWPEIGSSGCQQASEETLELDLHLTVLMLLRR